jgi:hypothetical protein
MGNVGITQLLARADLHLGATTIRRFLKEAEPVPEVLEEEKRTGWSSCQRATAETAGGSRTRLEVPACVRWVP